MGLVTRTHEKEATGFRERLKSREWLSLFEKTKET
jgi:hypothetical protein